MVTNLLCVVFVARELALMVEFFMLVDCSGEVKRISYSRVGNGPIIRSVRPMAIEAGKEATLVVHGCNLVPETK